MITIIIPNWFFVLLVISVLLHIVNIGLDFYSKYLENEIIKEESKMFKRDKK